VQAMREAIREEMHRDEDVFVIGEDIRIGGSFLFTLGLLDEFVLVSKRAGREYLDGQVRLPFDDVLEYLRSGTLFGTLPLGRVDVSESDGLRRSGTGDRANGSSRNGSGHELVQSVIHTVLPSGFKPRPQRPEPFSGALAAPA